MKMILWRIYYDILPVLGWMAVIAIAHFTFYYYPNKFLKQSIIMDLKLDYLISEIAILNKDVDKFENEIQNMKKKKVRSISVTITAYTSTKDQCDDTPFITASNIRVRKGIIALSRDIEKDFGLKFGDKVEIKGLGIFEFQDRMNKRWTRKVDIFMLCREKAIKFGNRKGELRIL